MKFRSAIIFVIGDFSNKFPVSVRSNTNCCWNGIVAVPNYSAEVVENDERKINAPVDYKTNKILHVKFICSGSVTQKS